MLQIAALTISLAVLAAQSGISERDAVEALRNGRYREALQFFDDLVTRNPGNPQGHYGRAIALAGLFDYGGAVASFEKAIALDPSLAAAHRQLVILYCQLGQRESARDSLRRATALAPVPDGEALSLGRALRKAGLLDEARPLLQHSTSPAHRFELGLLEMEEGNAKRAAELLAVAAESFGTAAALYEHARALEALGKTKSAVEIYRRVTELSSNHRQARFRLGSLLLRAGEKAEGERLLRGYEEFRQWERRVKLSMAMLSSGTLSSEEWREKALDTIELLLGAEALTEAAPLIEAGLAKHPDDVRFRLTHVRWLLSSGALDDARRKVDEILALASPPLESYRLSGQIFLREQQPEEALRSYRKLLELEIGLPAPVYREIATAYAMTSRLREAVTYFERALEADPSYAAARADLGLVLESLGEIEEAEAHYRGALEIDPGLVSAQQGLGSLLLLRGEAARAVELFRQSILLNPRDPLLRQNLALALEKAGRREEAEAERLEAEKLRSRK